ncbi:MAG: hypothetical protein LBR74_10375 [Eubacterium sp.]|jgi:hypothetical protein|nr:hypothetical protein [Eubacterium sp.]
MTETNASKFEDLIEQRLTGEMKEVAMSLAAYLNEVKLTPIQSSKKCCWKVPFNGKCLMGMWVGGDNNFDVHFWYGDFSQELNAESASAVQNRIACCYVCHDGCTGGFDTSVFGKEIKNVCSQHTIQFNSPTANDLPHIKNMLEYSKKYMLDSESYHANHF